MSDSLHFLRAHPDLDVWYIPNLIAAGLFQQSEHDALSKEIWRLGLEKVNEQYSDKYYTILDPNAMMKDVKLCQEPGSNTCPYYVLTGQQCFEYEHTCTYRWVTTQIKNDQGKVKFLGSIHQLAQSSHRILYDTLAHILSIAVPALNQLKHLPCPEDFQQMRIGDENTSLYQSKLTEEERWQIGRDISSELASLWDQAKTLPIKPFNIFQAAVKIQKIKLSEHSPYDGVWHTDGGIHHRILGVVLYYYDVSKAIKGGDMMFAWKGMEYAEGGKDADIKAAWEKRKKCSVPVQEGTLIVFSNYEMAHKVAPMVCDPEKNAERGFVAFFIVDPHFKLPSTNMLTYVQWCLRSHFSKDLITIVQEYAYLICTKQEARRMRKEIFEKQMHPQSHDGFVIFTNGNADSHEVCHKSWLPEDRWHGHSLKGQEVEDELPDEEIRNFW